MSKPDWCPQDVWDDVRDPSFDAFCATEAIEAQRIIARAILSAKAEERRQCIADLMELVLYSGKPGAVASNPYVDLNKAAAHLRKRGEA